ncbi:hypothetical protein QR680_008463 [Steinernema hermaphroditum]|uniref:Phosphodiesterase n=1 Tax=Steinernema hermaphroditum TaxID=289476 RepID=A0AA39M828_9BILA|nr:hypothetical protein QR680_008463 [Steinernema hermaphroditum]
MAPGSRSAGEAAVGRSSRRLLMSTTTSSPPDSAVPLSEEQVLQYLRTHPSVLERFVTGPHISRETFQKWQNRRNGKVRRDSRKPPMSRWILPDLTHCRKFLLDNAEDQGRIIYEVGVCCSQIVQTDQWEVVLINEDGTFVGVKEENGTIKWRKLRRNKKQPTFVQSLVDSNGSKIGEIYFYQIVNDRDRQLVNIVATWASALIYFIQLTEHIQSNGTNENDSFAKQQKLSSFLLDVAKSIFQDIVSMDAVIMKVMNFAQKLVHADRASLFLVDSKTNELYARIFDVGTGADEHMKIDADGKKEIRFPIGRGIAGHVAKSGEGLNIENAYDDDRFNRDIDLKTGYMTKTILCMPIFIRGIVIGVVQMVNKQEGVFTKADEDAFETFAVYCGLALHHAKLYDKIRRSEQKYRVALEVLAYHSVCNKDEVNKLKKVQVKEHVPELETFDFNGMKLSELEKPLYAVYMFKNLFHGKIYFEYDDLVRFVLTVRKNYRRVAYHNWAHGWSVAHAMFVLLKITDVFTDHEALALYVACLCHDLDHRGKNNAYMKTMSTPLAAIYSTSVMEHHHFNQTVTILQQDGHNILKSLSSEEYKKVLSLIKHCILATDLALFFPNKAKLNAMVDSGQFDMQENDHRMTLQAILMTGCDLIASAKPWQVQTETVKVIFEEFYEQGDAEKMNGREPIPMMDRTKAHELPQMQVGFMRGICVPCYDLMSKIVPEAKQLKDRSTYNATKWEELALEQKRREEREKAKAEAAGK